MPGPSTDQHLAGGTGPRLQERVTPLDGEMKCDPGF